MDQVGAYAAAALRASPVRVECRRWPRVHFGNPFSPKDFVSEPDHPEGIPLGGSASLYKEDSL